MPLSPTTKIDALLESSLPDLVRLEAERQWAERWIGQKVESYRIESLIGAGAYGVVFRAHRSAPFERDVAIKLLPSLQGPAEIERFRKECQALADLSHPNIAQILTAGMTDDGTPYLVMPLLMAEPIDTFADRFRGDWLRLADVARQLAEAIDFAHSAGFLHCDLKPDNILVADDGHVTVTDFGLAVRLDELDELAQRPSWAPGAVGYAAPELFTSTRSATASVDIYSLGAILYRLLTGTPPHNNAGWLDTLLCATKGPPAPVSKQNPDAPVALASVCQRCLSIDPNDRYGSAAEIAQELAEFLKSSGVAKAATINHRPVIYAALPLLVVVLFALLIPSWRAKPAPDTAPIDASPVFAESLSDEEVQTILEEIDEQLLRPGVKDPADPGDFQAVFLSLQEAAIELDALLARAPDNKRVRQRTATGYFLLGRAALWMNEHDYADECVARSEHMFRELHREFPSEGFMFDFFHTLLVQGTLAPPLEQRGIHLHALGIILGLRKQAEQNLDYADAHACILNLLALDYSLEHNAELLDPEEAERNAREALEIARWTVSQPKSRPIHRKQVMNSLSLLSEIARMQGEHEIALERAELALLEAELLDEALEIADTKHELFDKHLKYCVTLRNVGRLEEAELHIERVSLILKQLQTLDWPRVEPCELRVAAFRDSLAQALPEAP